MKMIDTFCERYLMELYEYHKEKLFPIVQFYCEIQHILTSELKMTLRDVTSSDFHKTSPDCFFL